MLVFRRHPLGSNFDVWVMRVGVQAFDYSYTKLKIHRSGMFFKLRASRVTYWFLLLRGVPGLFETNCNVVIMLLYGQAFRIPGCARAWIAQRLPLTLRNFLSYLLHRNIRDRPYRMKAYP